MTTPATRYRHKSSGALALVVAYDQYSDRLPTVTLECTDPGDRPATEFPFDIHSGGTDPAHRPYVAPLTITLTELDHDWEPTP